MKTEKTYWFGAKRMGVGFGPRTWQGWAATGVYAILMFVVPQIVGQSGERTTRVACMTVLTIGFLVVFIWKLDTSKR